MRAPDFWAEGGALAALLAPLGAGYDLAGRLRRALVHPAPAEIPVICVGNLVAGGAGKTPVVIALAEATTWPGGCTAPSSIRHRPRFP
jgi:tetraacyldisaccharide 4'-kinase